MIEEVDIPVSGDSFVHLHTHTEFSMLDGAARLDDLFAECVRMGMPALAMTDHGNVFGAYELWRKANAHGVKPIIGMEGYLSPGSRHERKRVVLASGGNDADNPGEVYPHDAARREHRGHTQPVPALQPGSLEGYYYKPRMDRELLQTYGKGIIATTGCPSGEVQRLLQQDKFDAACQVAADYRDIFGRENFFCPFMDHGIEIERRIRDDLVRLKKTLDLPALATNDLHYTYAEDAKPQEVLLCVQTGKTMSDPNRFKFDAMNFYLKSPAEMRDQWDGEFPEACDNTLGIAERVHVEFTEGRDLMPRFPVPEGESEASWLVKEVERGLQRRFPGGVPDAHRTQADLLRRMVPTTFEDISAVLALYRPGPMGANAHNDYADRKNSRQEVRPIHPELAEPLADILDETFGLIVYQEQVMAIAQKVAGYSLGKADLPRRAMGKKKEIPTRSTRPSPVGCATPVIRRPRSRRCGTSRSPFSDYAFNRAHTAGYGLVSYWTAYRRIRFAGPPPQRPAPGAWRGDRRGHGVQAG